MGLAAFNRLRREQAERAKQHEAPKHSEEPAKPARKPKAK